MFTCPTCGEGLTRNQTGAGIFWVCSRCHGRAATISLLRHLVNGDTMRELWLRTFDQRLPRVRSCPSCRARMLQLSLPARGQTLVLDVCRTCQFVWFDAQEFEALPPLPPKPVVVDPLPPAARQALAIAQVERMAQEQAEAAPDWDDLRNVPALLGLPVETGQELSQKIPWCTWTVALLVALVSLIAFARPGVLEHFALVPAEVWRLGGLTLLTSFFLHGGVWHLLGNLYFLVVFGDNVEDYLGRWRWLALVLAATLCGNWLHVMGDPRSTLPCVGASGGISGLLAFYAFRFPQARLGMRYWLRYTWRSGWFTFPAWGGFAVWIVLQLLGAMQQVRGFSHVSSLAHLGGAVAGVGAWLLWRRIEVPPEKLPQAAGDEAPPVRRATGP